MAKAERAADELKQRLLEQDTEQATLEERYKALEIELATTVEEVLFSKASIRGVQNQALVTSRIAEVRVQLEAFSGDGTHPGLSERLKRANQLLSRADDALKDGNYSGAAFLAERAAELGRQAKIFSEFQFNVPNLAGKKAIPIIPPRMIEVKVDCNLREEPSIDAPRVGGLLKGQQAEAVARVGDWYQVIVISGEKAWVHRSVVE